MQWRCLIVVVYCESACSVACQALLTSYGVGMCLCLRIHLYRIAFPSDMKNMHLSVYLLRTLFSDDILQPHADNPEDMSSGLSMLQRRDVVSVMQLPGHFLRIRQWGGGASTKRDHTIPSVEK